MNPEASTTSVSRRVADSKRPEELAGPTFKVLLPTQIYKSRQIRVERTTLPEGAGLTLFALNPKHEYVGETV